MIPRHHFQPSPKDRTKYLDLLECFAMRSSDHGASSAIYGSLPEGIEDETPPWSHRDTRNWLPYLVEQDGGFRARRPSRIRFLAKSSAYVSPLEPRSPDLYFRE